jgi:hypothetical protein
LKGYNEKINNNNIENINIDNGDKKNNNIDKIKDGYKWLKDNNEKIVNRIKNINIDNGNKKNINIDIDKIEECDHYEKKMDEYNISLLEFINKNQIK